MSTLIEQISQKLPQAPESLLQEVLVLLNSVGHQVESSSTMPPVNHRTTSPLIAGKGQTLGDIVSPIVDEQDWECLQ
jgi:hypothetical protein